MYTSVGPADYQQVAEVVEFAAGLLAWKAQNQHHCLMERLLSCSGHLGGERDAMFHQHEQHFQTLAGTSAAAIPS